MGDPGFLSGLIGWLIGFAMGLIVEQIKIVLSFPEQLEKLKSQKEYASYCGKNSSCSSEMKELLNKVSPLVESSCVVPWFNIISRYVMCKEMTTLISTIEMKQPLLFLQIGPAASGKMQPEVEGEVPVEKKDAMQTEVEGEVPVEKKAASGNFLSLLGAAALGAATTLGIVFVCNYIKKPTEEEKEPTEQVAVLPEPSLAQTGPTRVLAEVDTTLPLGEDAASAPVMSDATGPTPALAQDPSALTLPEEGAPALAQDLSALTSAAECAPAPALSRVTVDATPAVPEMVAGPEEASKALATPGAEEGVLTAEGKSTNRGRVSGFMGILEQMNVDFSGRKQLASLEALAMEIRPTITTLKDRINFTSHGNGPAVEKWFKRLEQHLQEADDMIEKYKGHFIYNGKTRKRICELTTEINALLKLGQMIISIECFKNEMIIC